MAPVPLVIVAGPVCWNSLPDYLQSPELSFDCFKQHFYFVNINRQLALLQCIRDIVDVLYKSIIELN